MRVLLAVLIVLMTFPLSIHGAVIENEMYSVRVEPAGGRFSVVNLKSNTQFLNSGRFAQPGGAAEVEQVTDATFGDGKRIQINHANGDRDAIELYPTLPFVLFRSSKRNGAADPIVLNHVPTLTANVELGMPASELRSLGTGGLKPVGAEGSYAFLAVADPKSRSGVVAGWITEDRGSGVVLQSLNGGRPEIKAQIDYGHLRIKPGENVRLETLAIGYFDDARFGLEAYADTIAKVYAIKLPPHHPGFCTWYMEKHGRACDEKHLRELSKYAAKNLKPFGFDFVQIDDQWQEGLKTNGPAKNFTTNAPNGPYPSGMKAAADQIKQLGLTPGIWFMPFAGNYEDPYFRDHQDWFVKNSDGRPYETAWGGTCLDMTNPDARAHLEDVVKRISATWGYKLFKLDGFWTGSATKQIYINDGYREDGIGDATFFNPDKTNIEALRDGARLVRSAAGPEVFLLGCCVSQNMRSMGGSFGLLDAMRVGPDTGAGQIGAPHASRLWFLNGRVWWNDPDCVSVRAKVPLEQARLNATFTAIAGDLFYNSDWMPDFPEDRLNILRRCMPPHFLHSRPVDVFEHEPAQIWHLPDERRGVRRDVVAFYNWGEHGTTLRCSANRIGLPPAKRYAAFDFWGNRFINAFGDVVQADVAGHGCCVLAIRPVSDYPQLLSTSRHVTQGMIDVFDEKWDSGTKTLSGVSQIVGNDPYELRVVVPEGRESWRLIDAAASATEQAARVKTDSRQEGPAIRVRLETQETGKVSWKLRFGATTEAR